MDTVRQSRRFIFRNVVLHVLASAVVVFAFQAKLALYKKAPEPGIAAAKLSTEKNSSKLFAAVGKFQPNNTPADFSTLARQLLADRHAAPAALPGALRPDKPAFLHQASSSRHLTFPSTPAIAPLALILRPFCGR